VKGVWIAAGEGSPVPPPDLGGFSPVSGDGGDLTWPLVPPFFVSPTALTQAGLQPGGRVCGCLVDAAQDADEQ
jgi:hypothetical protein